MGEKSNIQWTTSTWNPWQGCHKVSQGCKFCYAESLASRWGKNFRHIIRSGRQTFNMPLRLKEPARIFSCSISDFFIEEADSWRQDAWDIIKATPQHTYQILTKRPERIKDHLPPDWGKGYPNVWLGISGETVYQLLGRAKHLSTIPCVVKFLSAEPLLESMSGHAELVKKALSSFQWVIIGGESGKTARICMPEWIQGLITISQSLNIAVFVKQMGTQYAKNHNMTDWHGGNIEEFPKNLKIREFPVIK